MSPVFLHDCDKCVFCGNWAQKDVYVHISEKNNVFSVILRHGNEPEENQSYPVNILLNMRD